MLKEQLTEAKVLERYLKDENVRLKDRVAELRKQKKSINRRGTFYYRNGYIWYQEAIRLAKRVKILRRDIHQLRGRTTTSSQLHLLVESANRA